MEFILSAKSATFTLASDFSSTLTVGRGGIFLLGVSVSLRLRLPVFLFSNVDVQLSVLQLLKRTLDKVNPSMRGFKAASSDAPKLVHQSRAWKAETSSEKHIK